MRTVRAQPFVARWAQFQKIVVATSSKRGSSERGLKGKGTTIYIGTIW